MLKLSTLLFPCSTNQEIQSENTLETSITIIHEENISYGVVNDASNEQSQTEKTHAPLAHTCIKEEEPTKQNTPPLTGQSRNSLEDNEGAQNQSTQAKERVSTLRTKNPSILTAKDNSTNEQEMKGTVAMAHSTVQDDTSCGNEGNPNGRELNNEIKGSKSTPYYTVILEGTTQSTTAADRDSANPKGELNNELEDYYTVIPEGTTQSTTVADNNSANPKGELNNELEDYYTVIPEDKTQSTTMADYDHAYEYPTCSIGVAKLDTNKDTLAPVYSSPEQDGTGNKDEEDIYIQPDTNMRYSELIESTKQQNTKGEEGYASAKQEKSASLGELLYSNMPSAPREGTKEANCKPASEGAQVAGYVNMNYGIVQPEGATSSEGNWNSTT